MAAIEGIGPRQQHGPEQQGTVGLAGQLLEGEKQEKEQEQGGNPAHQPEQKAARPVGLGITGLIPFHQIGLLQCLPKGQITHETSVVVAASGRR